MAVLCSIQAQSPTPHTEFEVASIKRSNAPTNLLRVQPSPGGRLNLDNVPLRFLIANAYDVKDYQIIGAPDWTRTERYDVIAKAEGNASGRQMMGPMLQSLLRDRSKLVFHRETRELPAYLLTLSKKGIKLQATKAGSCTPWTLDSTPPVLAAGQKPPIFCGFRGIGYDGADRMLEIAGATMADLAAALSGALRQTVLDRTGLTGIFDVHLKWSPEIVTGPGTWAPSSDGPSLFTAIQEQLGLKLDATKTPVEVLVIDRLERPSEN
jgi:uncharacterized protein (TIGR03435 family)